MRRATTPPKPAGALRWALLLAAPLLLLTTLFLAACGGEATDGPACLCEQGQAGQTLWCEACGHGWVAGARTQDKIAVDAALADLVRAKASERGLAGQEVDRILSDIAAGIVKKAPACRCEACAAGHPEDHAAGPVPEDDAGPEAVPAPGPGDVPADDDASGRP
jgi:hypothetical protein